MSKLSLAVAAAIIAVATSAHAETKTWIVTEENTGGVKNAQGNWVLNIESGKITGTADMQLSNGNPLTYKVEGAAEGAQYKFNISDRSDGKKGCAWVGHPPSAGGLQTSGLAGYAECEGGLKMVIRAGF